MGPSLILGKHPGSSSSPSWTPQNFLTTNSASDNVTALNNALTTHRLIRITNPGVYELDGTVFIPSNTVLEFIAGCTIKKTGADFVHVFANKGILTRAHDTNINLIGNGLIIDINGNDTTTGAPLYGMRGQIGFFNVSNFLISGLKTTTIDLVQFFLHLTKVDNFVLRNIDAEGWKDGIHLGDAHDFLMEDIRTATGDDGIALSAFDWAPSNETLGDIYNGVIRRWNDDAYVGQGGESILMLPGSWTDWGNGVSYQQSDVVINGERIYQKTNAGTVVSSVAPTHISGSVTGADGIDWIWKQDGIIDHASVYNITIEDPIWKSDRALMGQYGAATVNYRPVFPGTYGQSITDNIVFDNITMSPVTVTVGMVMLFSKTGTIEVKNTIGLFNNANVALVTIGVNADGIGLTELKFTDCDITLTQTNVLLRVACSNITFVLTLLRTTVSNFYALFMTSGLANVNVNITASVCSFINKVIKLVRLLNTTTSIVNFIADACTFEETEQGAFENNDAGSQLNVTTTNSLGESIPLLALGTVDVTNSDLVLGLGDNILINGKFRLNVGYWQAVDSAIAWDASECMKITANGVSPIVCYHDSVLNPLSDNIIVRFRAKSPTYVGTCRWNALPNYLNAIINPAMTANWQNYELSGARGAASGVMYFRLDGIVNGDIIYVDNVEVIQY